MEWDNLSELEQCAILYSDLHKDVYGFRPRHDASDWTVDRYKENLDFLQGELEQKFDEHRDRRNEAFERFVKRVDDIMKVVIGCTHERAVEIIAESEDIDLRYDMGYFEYCMGLEYDVVKPWLAKIEA